MRTLYYHPAFAWNLIDCAVRERLMEDPVKQYGPHPQSYWARARADAQPWIGRENLRVALEMLPFADKVLLPGLDLRNAGPLWSEGPVDWAVREPRANAIWLLKEMVELKPFILKGLEHSKAAAPEKLFDQAVDSFRKQARKQQLENQIFSLAGDTVRIPVPRKLLARMPPKQAAAEALKGISSGKDVFGLGISKSEQTRYAEVLVRREFDFLRDAATTAVRGMPAVSPIPGIPSRPRRPSLSGEHAAAAVCLYFHEVRFPSPKTLAEAIGLKDNKNLRDWRTKICSWSEGLASEELHPEEIKREIEEANKYFKGAKFGTRLVPWWVHVLLVPVEALALFHPMPGVLDVAPFAIHGLAAYGEAVERAVFSAQDPSIAE